MHTIHYHVRESDRATELIGLLCERFRHTSDAEWRVFIERGRLTVNDQLAAAETPVRPGAIVGFDPTDHVEPPTNTDWQTLYEDDVIWVINKPAPLPCHRNGPYLRSNLMALLRTETDGKRMHLMARLDRDTNGMILIAKDRNTCKVLHHSNTMEKTYWCVVHGTPPMNFVCDEPMEPDPDHPTRQQCGTGKEALTHFHRLDHRDGFSLLEARPHTGRTHQIRCHLAHADWPIVGDSLYGGDHSIETQRQLLHAHTLSFEHPTQGPMTVNAPAPSDLEEACATLGFSLPLKSADARV